MIVFEISLFVCFQFLHLVFDIFISVIRFNCEWGIDVLNLNKPSVSEIKNLLVYYWRERHTYLLFTSCFLVKSKLVDCQVLVSERKCHCHANIRLYEIKNRLVWTSPEKQEVNKGKCTGWVDITFIHFFHIYCSQIHCVYSEGITSKGAMTFQRCFKRAFSLLLALIQSTGCKF